MYCVSLYEKMRIKPIYLRHINCLAVSSFTTGYLVYECKNAVNVKDSLQLKNDGEIPTVPPSIVNLIDEVKEDMLLKYWQITPFMYKGDVLKGIGYAVFNNKNYLAVPEYFALERYPDEKFTAMLEGEDISDDSPEFLLLKDAMFLSQEAKKFGIASEIFEKNYSALTHYLFSFIFLLNANCVSYIMEFDPLLTTFGKRISTHFTIFAGGIAAYYLVDTITCIFVEWLSNNKVCRMDKSYIKGGIEYYEKMLTRNAISKKLNESAPYTEEGERIRTKTWIYHMPLKGKINYLKNLHEGKGFFNFSYFY